MKSLIPLSALYFGFISAESIAPAARVQLDLMPEFVGLGSHSQYWLVKGNQRFVAMRKFNLVPMKVADIKKISSYSFVKCGLTNDEGMRIEIESVLHNRCTCQQMPSPNLCRDQNTTSRYHITSHTICLYGTNLQLQ